MSAFKQMPNQKQMHFNRRMVWVVLIVVLGMFIYLKKHGEPTLSPTNLTSLTDIGLVTIFFATLVWVVIMERVQRCPDCKKHMSEVYEDFHPQAKTTHVFYCERCDIIWDTTLPNSRD
jgi:hypothetical protein